MLYESIWCHDVTNNKCAGWRCWRFHHATHESSAAKVLRMLCDLKKLYIQIVLMSVLYRFVAVSDRPLQCLCLCMSFLEAGLWKRKKDRTVPKRTVKREPWLRWAAARWSRCCTGINGALAESIIPLICWNDRCPFTYCGNNALDSWHIDIWRLVVRWNICLLRFWNFWHESSICKLALRFHWKKIVGKLSAWFAGQHATAFCANLPIKAVRQKQSVLLQPRAIDFLLAIVCVSYLHSANRMCV